MKIGALLVLPLCLVAFGCQPEEAEETAASVHALAQHQPVYPVHAHPRGATYAEWSARWWQWSVSLPINENPIFDGDTCTNGANGQSGPVWFLAAGAGVHTRNCDIPLGKSIFAPLVAVDCSTLESEPFHGDNECELRKCLDQFTFTGLAAYLDGVPISDLQRFIVESPLFHVTVPDGNWLGVDAGEGDMLARGAYLFLKPLSRGDHTVRIAGEIRDAVTGELFFSADTTFHLTVD